MPALGGKVQRKSVDKKTHQYTAQDIYIDIPSVYSAYNYGKVGTDRMDQMVPWAHTTETQNTDGTSNSCYTSVSSHSTITSHTLT